MVEGARVFRNNYKGHMDKTKGVWKQGREVGMVGGGGGSGWGVNAGNCNSPSFLPKPTMVT